MKVIQYLLREKGFSERTAADVLHRRLSSSEVYECKWKTFTGWCPGRNLDPVRACIQDLADFFVFLRRDKGLSISAIKGYRSTLSQVFGLKDMDLTLSRELSMLFRSFEKSCSPKEIKPPCFLY